LNGGESSDHERLQRRLERERASRREAETIAERVTSEFYASVQELKRLNREVGRANRELEAANQTLKDFMAVAAHDLRGPVSAVVGFASTILRRWEAFSDAEKQEYVGIIEGRARYMTRMLDSLLTVSKIELGAIEVHREVIDVDKAVRTALVELGDLAADVEVRSPDGLRVVADPDHVHRILVNYITNAFRYGAPPVVVEARDDGRYVEMMVTDHGDGVPADFAGRLFHKFARAETEGTRQEAGTGLGLSIVRGLALANDGDAWYVPNQPTGSRFAVRLPKRVAA
jgi:signal transduction histidine kinase